MNEIIQEYIFPSTMNLNLNVHIIVWCLIDQTHKSALCSYFVYSDTKHQGRKKETRD